MTELLIDPKIALHVDAALVAGFTVYALPTDTPRPAGFVALCLKEDGPWAHIQVPTHNWEPVSLDVPIKPSREYGSGVLVDHDGTPEDAVRALRQACTEPMVAVRFVTKRGEPMPKVPNHGRGCIERWPGAADFTKLEANRGNWRVQQLAGRLEIGDRFESKLEDGRDFGTLTVKSRRYRDDIVILWTEELSYPVEIRERTFVTMAGAA